ncbi:MAG: 16S rRNA (guanine(966)-N(2))-methyltransferase RsmD [Candidatus Tantalella remota]|nr:16S rRNA (guanine(966)-N(2))-methyltransferase RsmD [Candidatus Tantalella remota]
MTMRIIGGDLRGRKITQPALDTVRPTKDRIRESVFSIISAETPDSVVLDLFSGSGAYGLEALSRGASSSVFVDKDPECCRIITENIKSLGLKGISTVMTGDAENIIESLAASGNKFDLIFSDPSYNTNMSKNILIKINQYDILNPSGTLVVEHSSAESIPAEEGNVFLYKQKTYKDIGISVYRRA